MHTHMPSASSQFFQAACAGRENQSENAANGNASTVCSAQVGPDSAQRINNCTAASDMDFSSASKCSTANAFDNKRIGDQFHNAKPSHCTCKTVPPNPSTVCRHCQQTPGPFSSPSEGHSKKKRKRALDQPHLEQIKQTHGSSRTATSSDDPASIAPVPSRTLLFQGLHGWTPLRLQISENGNTSVSTRLYKRYFRHRPLCPVSAKDQSNGFIGYFVVCTRSSTCTHRVIFTRVSVSNNGAPAIVNAHLLPYFAATTPATCYRHPMSKQALETYKVEWNTRTRSTGTLLNGCSTHPAVTLVGLRPVRDLFLSNQRGKQNLSNGSNLIR